MFGLLFVFHYATQKAQRRREDEEVLKNLEAQELRSGLQELLLTLRQVGGEVSGELQEKVHEAEAAGTRLGILLDGLKADLASAERLAREASVEREQLEAKMESLRALKSARKPKAPKPPEEIVEDETPSTAVGFSTTAVKEIYRLADESMGVTEIARRTQLTRGEVQLILNLRGNRFSTPN
jgi:hypothetical protein